MHKAQLKAGADSESFLGQARCLPAFPGKIGNPAASHSFSIIIQEYDSVGKYISANNKKQPGKDHYHSAHRQLND